MMNRLNSCLRYVFFAALAITTSACTPVEVPGSLVSDTGVEQPVTSEALRLLTLNMAHGRKDSINQLFLTGNSIRSNLDDMARFLVRTDADVVALQEADGPSYWSGRFDHVGYLASASGYPWNVRSDHERGRYINFGTGLLSKVPFKEVLSHDFPESPPTLRKGFTLGQIQWQFAPDKPFTAIDVLSVHLDFSRRSVREVQIEDILTILEKRDHPVILMGDFNSEWLGTESAIQRLVASGEVRVYKPASDQLGTYRSGKKRLDWVLLSKELEFINYEVLPDIVSDHQAVLVEVGLSEN